MLSLFLKKKLHKAFDKYAVLLQENIWIVKLQDNLINISKDFKSS